MQSYAHMASRRRIFAFMYKTIESTGQPQSARPDNASHKLSDQQKRIRLRKEHRHRAHGSRLQETCPVALEPPQRPRRRYRSLEDCHWGPLHKNADMRTAELGSRVEVLPAQWHRQQHEFRDTRLRRVDWQESQALPTGSESRS